MRLWGSMLAALAIAGAADAQEPPAAPAIEPAPAWAVRFYSEHCGADALSAHVDIHDNRRTVLVTNDAGPVIVAGCDEQLHAAYPVVVNSLSSALVFMAYKPFEPFWPFAEARWGDDLSKLRTELRERALHDVSDRSSYAVGPETALAINSAHALIALGYFDQAREVLTKRADVLMARGAKRKHKDDFDLVLLAIARGGDERAQHGYSAAADYLASFARSVSLDDDYALNLTVNRAAYLAEAGRHDEALKALQPAKEVFDQRMFGSQAYQIGGSDREFAWILACAYTLKGEPGLASQYASIVNSAEERPMDEYMQATKPTTMIRLRMTRCSNDPAGYFAAWRSTSQPILSPAWLEFQQGGDTRLGVARPWVATRPEAGEIAAMYRQLPPRYDAALRRWQAANPPVN